MALAGVDWTGVLLVAFTLAVFAAPLVAMFPPRPVRRSEALQQTHRRLGLRAAEDGGVAEQQRRRQGDVAAAAADDDDDGPSAAAAPQVHSLHVYPIKSCRGIEVVQATVLASGLEYDRLYLRLCPAASTVNDDGRGGGMGGGDAAPAAAAGHRQGRRLASAGGKGWRRAPGAVAGGAVPPDRRRPPAPAAAAAGGQAVGRARRDAAARLPVGRRHRRPRLRLGRRAHLARRAARPQHGARAAVRPGPLSRRQRPSGPVPQRSRAAATRRLGRRSHRFPRLVPGAPRRPGQRPPSRDPGAQGRRHAAARPAPVPRQHRRLRHRGLRRGRLDLGALRPPRPPGLTWRVCCRTTRCKLPNVDPATGHRHQTEPDRALRKYRAIDGGAPKTGCLGMQLCPSCRRPTLPTRGRPCWRWACASASCSEARTSSAPTGRTRTRRRRRRPNCSVITRGDRVRRRSHCIRVDMVAAVVVVISRSSLFPTPRAPHVPKK